MNSKQKFFICNTCNNMVGLIKDEGPPMVCCGDEMEELIPNTVEASAEKHLPAVTVNGGSVNVQIGSVPHPMEDGHNISFVFVETSCGGQRKKLAVGAAPTVSFSLVDDTPVAVYAYCNLHGLWKTEI